MIANMILEQMFPQLNDTVLSYKKIGERINNKVLEINYNVQYKNLGNRTATIKCNAENKLLELLLTETMQVKTMSSSSDIEANIENEIIISFTQSGNLIVVEVLLNGNLRPFIVDSGSPRLVLNSVHVKILNTNQETTSISNSIGINGSISDMNITRVDSLSWAGINKRRRINNEFSAFGG